MNKTVRIVLYVLSILTVAGVFAAFIFAGAKTEDTQVMTEELSTAELSTEEAVNIQDDNAIEDTDSKGADAAKEETEATKPPTDAAGTTDAQGDVTLVLTGDVLFANAFKASYDAAGIQGVVSEHLLKRLLSADILMVNNEFPFSDRGVQMADKQFTFRCSPSYVKALTEMGVDMVSLANNHTLDYGKEALSDTFATLDGAGILYGGAGESVERAEEVQTMEAGGKTIGFLAVSRVIPTADWKVENATPGIFSCYDETRLVELVKQADAACDFLIVYPHWGVEYSENPENYQSSIAQKCVEAGADLIVGAHTHCLQGVEYFDGKPVFYSLGNFIFGQSIERSAAVEVTLKADGSAAYRLIPICAAGGKTQEMEAGAADSLYTYMQQISKNVIVDESGVVTEKK